MSVNEVKCLDHGFVKLRNISGPTRRSSMEFDADDVDPANTARMSFSASDQEDRTRADDLRLCRYLMKNWHTSPFEMIEVWLEMKLPIFVARQFIRHRTINLNEISGRYVKLPEEWYIPEKVGGKPDNAKQGQSDNLDWETQDFFKRDLNAQCYSSYRKYETHLENGIAAEHARMFLHLNTYTHWIWKQNLHNLFHFLSLRDHSHAQIEAQVYAKAVDKLVRRVLPECFSLYDKYRRQP